MANIGFSFNASEHKEETFYIPAGMYRAAVIETEYKDNNAGTGKYLRVDYQITEGNQQGNKVSEYLSIVHSNQKTVKIAHGRLSSICKACGITNLVDSDELLGKVVMIEVGVRPPNEEGHIFNKINKVEAAQYTNPTPAQAQPAQPPQQTHQQPAQQNAAPPYAQQTNSMFAQNGQPPVNQAPPQQPQANQMQQQQYSQANQAPPAQQSAPNSFDDDIPF